MKNRKTIFALIMISIALTILAFFIDSDPMDPDIIENIIDNILDFIFMTVVFFVVLKGIYFASTFTFKKVSQLFS